MDVERVLSPSLRLLPLLHVGHYIIDVTLIITWEDPIGHTG